MAQKHEESSQSTRESDARVHFQQARKDDEIKSIYEHNLDAFTDTPDFCWSFEEIKKEINEGWELYSATAGGNIIAAVFLKLENKVLKSKNTAIKMSHQGSGYSHRIKEFMEKKAREYKAKAIYHYCRIDNFRLYSLNESHGYHKTGEKLDDGQVVEWKKDL